MDWYTAEVGGVKWDFVEDKVIDNMILYAHWLLDISSDFSHSFSINELKGVTLKIEVPKGQLMEKAGDVFGLKASHDEISGYVTLEFPLIVTVGERAIFTILNEATLEGCTIDVNVMSSGSISIVVSY